MTNSSKYHFADFTIEHYRELLELAKSAYRFRTFTEFDRAEKFILWRHDIDLSVHRARRLAEIEAAAGVISTYFVHLHSEFYNALENDVGRLLREISELGHPIGLHFDSHYYAVSTEEQLEKHLSFERTLLENLLSMAIEVFSFHNTTAFTMSCMEDRYAGMIYVHSDYLQHEVGYVSDSNGYWRHRRLADVLAEHREDRLQVLTHPEWWQETTLSPKERVMRCVDGRGGGVMARYESLLAANGRLNIDW